jgi:hypothetical protein
MAMTQFKYQITMHAAESFKEVVYFCSEEGSCEVKEVPSEQIGKLEEILNERGQRGWELAQATFGKQGIMIFWKKAIAGTQQAESEG